MMNSPSPSMIDTKIYFDNQEAKPFQIEKIIKGQDSRSLFVVWPGLLDTSRRNTKPNSSLLHLVIH